MNSKRDFALGEVFGYPPLVLLKPGKDDGRIVSPGVVGIEIEAEGVRYKKNEIPTPEYKAYQKYWFVKEERSLRDFGAEFVTSPIFGSQITDALDALTAYEAQLLVSKMKFNDRTGIHVHMNVRDFSFSEILSYVFTYTLFERELYEFSGNRIDNIFCLPMESSYSGMREFYRCFSIGDWRSISHLVDKASKYLGLNYKNISGIGTLEFRHMAGTHEFNKIVDWINLILRMRDFVKVKEFWALKDRIFALNSDSMYEQFAEEVFKEELKFLTASTLAKNMAKSVALLKTWTVFPKELYVQDKKRADLKIRKLAPPRPGLRRAAFDPARWVAANVPRPVREEGWIGEPPAAPPDPQEIRVNFANDRWEVDEIGEARIIQNPGVVGGGGAGQELRWEHQFIVDNAVNRGIENVRNRGVDQPQVGNGPLVGEDI